MFLETISYNFQHLPQTEGDPSKDLNQALKVLGDSLNEQAPLKNLSRWKKKLSQKTNQSKMKTKYLELWFEPDSQTQELIIIIRNTKISLLISWKWVKESTANHNYLPTVIIPEKYGN